MHDTRRDARLKMLTEYPSLRRMYSEDDGLMEVFYLQNATASICAFTAEPKVITF